MARFIGGGSSGPDYVQPDEPTDPESPERWYDTDADPDGDGNAEGAMKVYGTDGTWHTVTIDDHGELGGVLEDNHHSYPVPNSGIVNSQVTVAGNKVSLGGSTAVSLQDLSDYPVPNSGIANSQVTVAGNKVSLGGSTAVSLPDLSDYPVNVGDLDFSSTKAVSKQGGYVVEESKSPSLNSGTTQYYTVYSNEGSFCDGVRVSMTFLSNTLDATMTRMRVSSPSGSQTIDHTDKTVPGGNGNSGTVSVSFSSRMVDKVELEVQADDNVQVELVGEPHVVGLPAHSHNL